MHRSYLCTVPVIIISLASERILNCTVVADELVLDALQYPFIAALASAFGPVAIGPFEDHLSMLHQYYEQQKGGSWFKSQTRASKLRSVESQSPRFYAWQNSVKGALIKIVLYKLVYLTQEQSLDQSLTSDLFLWELWQWATIRMLPIVKT